jgi:hypothetical protein
VIILSCPINYDLNKCSSKEYGLICDSCVNKQTKDEFVNEWLQAGYTDEQVKILARDSLINTNDMGKITAEDASSYLINAMSKYPINETDIEHAVDKLNGVDEQQIITYNELKETMNRIE